MNAGLIRARALVTKELRTVLRDSQSRRLLIAPVIVQLVLFPSAATLEVKNNALAIFDEDGGALTQEIIQRLTHTPAFSKVIKVGSDAQARDELEHQNVVAVLRFGPRFSADALRGQPQPIQALLDGRKSNATQIALGYVTQVVQDVPITASIGTAPSPMTVRHWYNPNLDYYRFIIPSLVAIITTISALVVTAMSVTREREQGTLDQLLVSPLTPSLIFFGKAAPAIIIAMVQGTIILCGGVLIYGVQFQGSLPLLYASMIAYIAALAGIGLMISSFCSTQQQAFLGVFTFIMPGILLSGYVTPVDNMPRWLQTLTQGNPLTHFIVIVRGLYLKAMEFHDFALHVAALAAIAFVTTSVALIVFRRRLA